MYDGAEEDFKQMDLMESRHLGVEVVNVTSQPLSEGFPATFFSNSTHLALISSTGGKHMGNYTACFFLLSLEPKIFEGTSLNSSGVVESSKTL